VKHSIRNKIALLLFLTTLIMSVVLIFLSNRISKNLIDNLYKERSDDISKTTAAVVDADTVVALRDAVLEIYNNSKDLVSSEDWGSPEFEAYVGQYGNIYDLPEYKSLLKQLKSIQNANHINCIYIYYVDLDRSNYVYLIDADNEEPCPIGCIDSYEWGADQARALKEHPEDGIPAYITKTEEYGWLVSNMMPIINEQNEVVAYACTDISMDTIIDAQNHTTLTLIGLVLICLIIVYVISSQIVNRSIIVPIVKLSGTAKDYWKENSNTVRNDFSELDINSNDEIGVLADSMKKMESDINDYFVTLNETKEELSTARRESDEMKKLANRDALTGIRNKTAYDAEIKNLEWDFENGTISSYGIAMVDLNYLKRINDTYGHDKGNVAIKKICRIVCEVFDHSPVFRIGGDEFAIILKKSDLENIDSLISEFRAIIEKESSDESLEHWERVSAAIGFAIYDPIRDQSVENVFKRADSNMYKDKEAQKAARD